MNVNYGKLLYVISITLITIGVCTAFLGEDTINKYYTFSFFTLFLWLLFEIKQHGIRKWPKKIVAFSFPILMILITNLLVVLSMNDMSNTTVIMLFDTMLMIAISVNDDNRFSMPAFFFMSLICTIIIFYAISLSFAVLYNKDYMTIVGFNPQSIGTWAYVLFASELIFLDVSWHKIKNKLVKTIVISFGWLVACFLFGIAYITETRSSELGMAFLIIVRLLPRLRVVNTVLFPIMVAFIPALVVFFSFILLFLGVGGGMEGGTILDSREYIWMSYLDVNFFQLLFGNIIEYENIYSHNIYIDILASHGIIALSMFIMLTSVTIKYICKNIEDRVQYDALFAFVGALIMASFEGMVFSIGCGGMYLYTYSFLMVARKNVL